MKVALLYKGHNFNLEEKLPAHAEFLLEDLELRPIIRAMAKEDERIEKVATQVLLSATMKSSIPTLQYRQAVLKDYIAHQPIVEMISDIATQVLEERKKDWLGIFSGSYPLSILSDARKSLSLYFDCLQQLQHIATQYKKVFLSEGFRNFFNQIELQINEDFLQDARAQLQSLELRGGISMDARIGKGNKVVGFHLNNPLKPLRWWQRLFASTEKETTFKVHPRDIPGALFLSEMKERALTKPLWTESP